MLTQGAIEAIELPRARRAQQASFLPKMVAGKWTGTMNLTEPQAGSDLAPVRTRAVPQGDGTYKLFGPEDLHHLRRARLHREHHPPRARAHARRARGREGHLAVRGAEVPRQRRRQRSARATTCECVSIEHKLGIHASPTARAGLRRQGRRVGYLVGEENRGLEYMFIMMNLARFSVGLRGRRRSPSAPTSAPSRTRATACRAGRWRLAGREAGADHRASRRPAHADDDARVDRGDARGRLRHRGRARTTPRSHPDAERASSTRRSSTS